MRFIAVLLAMLAAGTAVRIPAHAQAGRGVRLQPDPSALRLYVFDGGTLASADMSRYRLTEQEVKTTKMSVACYLVVHPRGTLMWDACAVPDASWTPNGTPQVRHLTLPDGQMREVTLTSRLLPQLADAGVAPERITYLALSHDHWDHTANANAFAKATWIAPRVERDAMLATPAPALTQPAPYGALWTSRSVIITGDEHDVFGDGTVVIKSAPGHTPGHQVLLVRLPKTGPVLLSGDLYHYPEERALKRVPTFEVDQAQTAASRTAIDAFLARTRAQLWIQHDFTANAALRKAPAFYD
jgi:glyoxylase-like metal-dependent hydrolase (beta-lactamase superfamily II)